MNTDTPIHTDKAAWLAAIAVPLAYLAFYTPYGMDTTDFGYFYAYGWRILNGQIPYRDFYYIKPALPLYWHAMWLAITPENWQILAGKAGFMVTMLASAWFGTLFLAKVFNLRRLGATAPLLATCGFVFGIHSFPHMPWHTADGVFFCALSLWFGSLGQPAVAGIAAGCAMLCKQSFLLVPIGVLVMLLVMRPRISIFLMFVAGWCAMLAGFYAWIYANDAWSQFQSMTTGQLDIREAIDAGLLIYLRQNWILPLLAVLPGMLFLVMKKRPPTILMPCCCYLCVLTIWYVHAVFSQKTWIGYGASWPTLFMLLGGACVFAPRRFLLRWSDVNGVTSAAALAAALLVSWSTAISGGYKIPAFFAVPLVFSFWLIHAGMGGNVHKIAWATLVAGLIMFGCGYMHPYVFPVRPLERNALVFDAGAVYPKASGVKVDADMLARLAELKALRTKYGPRYKTLPGFSFAYYLNDDKPIYASDWLIDWEINGDIDKLYKELLDKNLTVFMERDQMDTVQADGYERAGYGVPQKVRKNWRIVEETPHFVVFQPPLS